MLEKFRYRKSNLAASHGGRSAKAQRGPISQKNQDYVGGAPISGRFADKIGTDAYTADAVSAAKKAKELILR